MTNWFCRALLIVTLVSVSEAQTAAKKIPFRAADYPAKEFPGDAELAHAG